jgi:hypothetical protein
MDRILFAVLHNENRNQGLATPFDRHKPFDVTPAGFAGLTPWRRVHNLDTVIGGSPPGHPALAWLAAR